MDKVAPWKPEADPLFVPNDYFHAIWPQYQENFYAARGTDWQMLRELSCRLFQHDHFDNKTIQRLNDWLLAECNNDSRAWEYLRIGEVVRMLQNALVKKTRNAPSSLPEMRFPPVIYELLEFFEKNSSRETRQDGIPEELRDALDIALHHKLIKKLPVAGAPGYATFEAKKHDPLCRVTDEGRSEMAFWRQQKKAAVSEKQYVKPLEVEQEATRSDNAVTIVKKTQEPDAPTKTKPVTNDGAANSTLIALIAALGDEGAKIMVVASKTDISTDQKMRAIYAIDNQSLGWRSKKWATVLSVSDSMIRQTEWWKVDRKNLLDESRY